MGTGVLVSAGVGCVVTGTVVAVDVSVGSGGGRRFWRCGSFFLLPPHGNLGVALVIIIFDFDILIALIDPFRAGNRTRRAVSPLIYDGVTTDPNSHPVIDARVEAIETAVIKPLIPRPSG